MAKNHFFTTLVITMIQGYRLLGSLWCGHCCRFYPTCSLYAIHALEQHGCLKGGYLLVKRLLSCHPWHAGGVDPVPTAHDSIINTINK